MRPQQASNVDLTDALWPVRVNSACFSMNANASFKSAWWARSITTATAGSATAHRVETDFTGENVKSKPATVCVRGRESFAICPASSRASIGSRPCAARKKLRATSVCTRAGSAGSEVWRSRC
jgi:hypothetical protein